MILLEKILNKYGIENQKDFYFIITIFGIICFISSFGKTYVNLDLYQFFKKGLVSWNFSMPFLGALLGTLFFPKIRGRMLSKNILQISFVSLFIILGLMIFLMYTWYDFPLRFFIGFFVVLIFLEISCFEAEIFQAPYRATLFSLVGIEGALLNSLGSSFIGFVHSPLEAFGVCMSGLLICCGLIFIWKTPSGQKKKSLDKGTPNSKQAFYKIICMFPFVFIAIFMMGGLGEGISTYLPIYFENLGLNKADAAFAYSFAGLGGLVLMPLAGRIGDKYGYEEAFFLTIILGLFAVSMTFFNSQTYVLSFLFFLISGTKQAFISLSSAWIATQYSGKSLSYGMATFSLTKMASHVFAPLSFGALMNSYENRGFLLGCLGAFGMTFILMILQNKKSS
ncbi:MAG: MFS transporter [Proteobacteria bacterium]|nr:MFS transporter [Pseudomonadota bacterium]